MPKPKQCSYDKEPAVCSLMFTDLTPGMLVFRANLCDNCRNEMKSWLRNWCPKNDFVGRLSIPHPSGGL